MAMDEGPLEDDNPPAGWIMTFADLMSLLMCFFVLLLSFSEMDVQKYKQVAGSMQQAFGVQREVKANDRVKGTSIIAQEYSPGKPEQTLDKVLRQQTTDETLESIVTHKGQIEDDGEGSGDGEDTGHEAGEAEEIRKRLESDQQLKQLMFALRDEIMSGAVQIELYGDMPLIKVQEKSAFPSGRADLDPEFLPVLHKIANAIIDPESKLIVSGHTDDVPINTPRYPSNWILSAARAASVVEGLGDNGVLDMRRMEIRAHADTQPLVPNDTAENRARNRRVEILITSRLAKEGEEVARTPITLPPTALRSLYL